MSYNKQFETLFSILDSKVDIDEDFKKVFIEAVENAGFCQVKKSGSGSDRKKVIKKSRKSKKSDKKKPSKPRKVSGYNMFIGDQIKTKGKTMKQAVPLWKALSKKEQEVWKAKADQLNKDKINEGKKNRSKQSSDYSSEESQSSGSEHSQASASELESEDSGQSQLDD